MTRHTCVVRVVAGVLAGAAALVVAAQPLTLVRDFNTDRSAGFSTVTDAGAHGALEVTAGNDPLRPYWLTDGSIAGTRSVMPPTDGTYRLFGLDSYLLMAGQGGLWTFDPQTRVYARIPDVPGNGSLFGETFLFSSNTPVPGWYRVNPLSGLPPQRVPDAAYFPQSGDPVLNGVVYYDRSLDPNAGDLWAFTLDTGEARIAARHAPTYLPPTVVGAFVLTFEIVMRSANGDGEYAVGRYDPVQSRFDSFPIVRVPSTSIGPYGAALGRWFVIASVSTGAQSQSEALLAFDPVTGITRTHLTPNGHPSNPPCEAAGAIYFDYQDATHGRELFRLRLESTQPELVTDIRPGTPGALLGYGSIFPRSVGGKVWFQADDGASGLELWMHNPADGSTRLVRDIRPGPTGSSIHFRGAAGDILLFSADDGIHGRELWRSDGSESGTFLLRDFQTGTNGSAPSGLARVGTRLIFSAATIETGRCMYGTDGTSPGTVTLATSAGTDPPLPYRGRMIIGGTTDPPSSLYLAITDGTLAGTTPITAAPASGRCGPPQAAAVSSVGTRLFFGARQGNACEPWISDATNAGTRLLRTIFPTAFSGSQPSDFRSCGGYVYFVATDAARGRELWRTDGTLAGTRAAADLLPGPASSYPSGLVSINDRLYLAATTPDGRALLGIDPRTNAVNTIVADPAMWLQFISPEAVGGRLLLAIGFADQPARLFTFGPASPTLIQVSELVPASTYHPQSATAIRTTPRHFFFSALDGANVSPCAYDAATGSASILMHSVAPRNLLNEYPGFLTTIRSRTLFSADDGIHGRELWITDGTPAGTRLFADLVPGPAPSKPSLAEPVGDRLYLSCSTPEYGEELYFMTLCPGDFDLDGGVTIEDLLGLLNAFEVGSLDADYDEGSGAGTPDGGVTIDDLLYFLHRWEAGC